MNIENKKYYRHGTRFPGKKVISKYLNLPSFRDELLKKSTYFSKTEREAFKAWTPLQISLDQQKYLTKEGEEELLELGKRFKLHFPMFFNDDQSSFSFKHTPTQRTNLSAKKFIEGLFGNENEYKAIEVSRDDPVLRPYKGCPLWRTSVKKNPESLKEKIKFLESSQVENMMNKLKEITGIDYLDFKDIELIYTMCGYETAWRHKLFHGKSIWCSLFKDENHLKIMEYLEDLEYFYIDGYGFEVTRKVACNTVNDLLTNLDPSDDERKLSFKFTHSGTILKLLTFLELYSDDFHLSGENFIENRKWKTSHIDTFSTNLIAILYE